MFVIYWNSPYNLRFIVGHEQMSLVPCFHKKSILVLDFSRNNFFFILFKMDIDFMFIFDWASFYHFDLRRISKRPKKPRKKNQNYQSIQAGLIKFSCLSNEGPIKPKNVYLSLRVDVEWVSVWGHDARTLSARLVRKCLAYRNCSAFNRMNSFQSMVNATRPAFQVMQASSVWMSVYFVRYIFPH